MFIFRITAPGPWYNLTARAVGATDVMLTFIFPQMRNGPLGGIVGNLSFDDDNTCIYMIDYRANQVVFCFILLPFIIYSY
jgi:hypothetical protein